MTSMNENHGHAHNICNSTTAICSLAGVTYCGDSKSSDGLTLQNVPWHEEVLYFVRQLEALLDGYEIACEHEHSNCVLLAQKKVVQSPVY